LRLALVSDVHGNCVALDAVLADLERLGVDSGICLGDVAQGGPQPAESLDRVRELGWPVILGNADDFLLRVPDEPAEPVTERQLEVREWTLSRLTDEHLALIGAFSATVELELDGGSRLLAFHGSPRSFDDGLLPETQPGPAYEADADVLAGGHTHLQWTRRLGSAVFVNPGSVGLAYDRHQPPEDFRTTPIAEYAVLHADAAGVAVEFRRVPYDLDRLLAAASEGGRPDAAEYAGLWRRVV
jgi:predicted phosphodiesterase